MVKNTSHCAMERKEKAQEGVKGQKMSFSSVWTIFMLADAADLLLMSLGFLGSLVDGVSIPVVIVIGKKIMNDIAETPPTSPQYTQQVNKSALNYMFVACAVLVACIFEGYCWTRTGERQASRMRGRYLKAILRQDVEYFDLNVAASDVITSVSTDSLVIQDVISEKLPDFIANCSCFLGCYIAAFFLTWRLALVAFPTVLLLIVPGIIYVRVLMGLSRKMQKEYGKAGAIAEQTISSIRTVYSFVGEQKMISDFSTALEGSFKLGVREGLVKGIAIGSNGVTFAVWAFVIWYGSRLVMYHGAKGGSVYAVGAAIVLGGQALGIGLSNVKYFSEAIPAVERILEVIKRVPKIDSENMDGETLENVAGDIEFKSVQFAYPTRQESITLNGFNLKVSAGRTVALVGASGSGKSTVIALLERFYDPAKGEILLDGVDIRRLQLKWLRSQMGLVNQEPALFATSIKENILFGKEDASMDDVMTAAKIANAHNFISQLPDGYDTQVGERGAQLSGGQRQRIAIARAVLKSPKILLLDEATSALDSESERVVQEALEAALVGRTTIVIAHRLSTIRNADVIAVVQAGQVVEAGSHDKLMHDEQSVYTSLVRFQLGLSEKKEAQSSHTSTVMAFVQDHSSRHSISRRFSFASRSSSVAPEEQVKPVIPVPSFRRLLLLNAPEWKQGALGSLNAMFFGAIQPLYAFFMGSMLSAFFLKDHDDIKAKTRLHSLIFVSLTCFSLITNIGQHYSFGIMGECLTKRVRERMLSKILTFEVGWFDQEENSIGAICSRLAKDAAVVRSLVGDRMSLILQIFSAIIVACVMVIAIAWRLALILIVVLPLIVVCYYTRQVLLKSLSKKAIKAQSESSKLAVETVSNHRTITAFSSQLKILRLFELAQEGPRRENMRQAWVAGVILGITHSLIKCAIALIFWFGGRFVANDRVTVKALFQTFCILIGVGRVAASAGTMAPDLAKGNEAVGSLFSMLDRKTYIEPEDYEGHQPKTLTGNIDIIEVDFAYPSRPHVKVLKNFSFSIEAGKSTALVGRSGSGKSTIIGLIERFYDPIKGAVKIDGRDIRKYHLRSLRRHISLVSQEPTLFAGSIRENIVYGVEDATEVEIEAAARAANAHDFISSLRDGYNTWCGDKGVQLSGGQRQRVAIARAILKNPRILLLDEATSALDNASEKMVQQALERLMVGRTSVLVAHRLSTIENCDLIAVLDKGEVVEQGTHASLLAKGPKGTYFGLVNLQQNGKAMES